MGMDRDHVDERKLHAEGMKRVTRQIAVADERLKYFNNLVCTCWILTSIQTSFSGHGVITGSSALFCMLVMKYSSEVPFLIVFFSCPKGIVIFLLIISSVHVNGWLNREFPFTTSVMEMGDVVCGLLKQGKICVLFRSCAQREEGQSELPLERIKRVEAEST